MLPEQILGLGAVFMLSLSTMNALTPGYSLAKILCSAAITTAAKLKFLKYSGPRRRMSYASAQLVNGPFPEECKVPDPIINALIYFEEAPTMEALIELAETQLLPYERFSSVPVMAERGACVWQNVHVHARDHYYKHFVANAVEAHELMTEITSRPLNNPLLPRWEFHLIVNKAGKIAEGDLDAFDSDTPFDSSEKHAIPASQTGVLPASTQKEEHLLVFRINHAIGDGIAIVSVFYQFLKDVNGIPLCESQNRFKRNRSKSSSLGSYLKTLVQFLKALVSVLKMPNTPYDTKTSFTPYGTFSGLKSPEVKSIPSVISADEVAASEITERQALVCSQKISKAGHRAKFQHPSSVVMIPKFSLDLVKRLKNAAGGTVNDICAALTAGAIRRYCLSQNDAAFSSENNFGASIKCSMLLPVAFPRSLASIEDRLRALRNVFSFSPAVLPIGEPSMLRRIELVKADTQAIKTSLTPVVALKCTDFMNMIMPQRISQGTGADTFSKNSLIFSNVPGPDSAVVFAGKVVSGMQMVYPNLITQVGILSYNGALYMNLTLDAVKIPNAQRISSFFIDELKEMCEQFSIEYVEAE